MEVTARKQDAATGTVGQVQDASNIVTTCIRMPSSVSKNRTWVWSARLEALVARGEQEEREFVCVILSRQERKQGAVPQQQQ